MEANLLPVLIDFKQQDRYENVRKVLNSSLIVLFDELFTRMRYFDLGLEFVHICMEEIGMHKDEIEHWRFNRNMAYLIQMKLKMLDYQNEWEEYINYANYILSAIKIPYELNFGTDIPPRYKYYDDNNKSFVHFLYQDRTRYDIICRKLVRQKSGKSVEHLKRHQRDELSYEGLEYRRDAVLKFFSACNYDFDKKQWR